MAARLLRFVRAVGLSVLVAALSTAFIALTWRLIGGGPMSVHGWIALTTGVSATFGLAWLLMGLAFHSSRAGWDDRVDNSLDPGLTDDE